MSVPEAPRADVCTDALDLLDQVIASEGRFSADMSTRVRTAIRAYAQSNGARSLEECFGWKPQLGERSIARRLAEAKRRAGFVEAWRSMLDAERLSEWRRCEVLASELTDFENTYWPAWSERGMPEGTSRRGAAFYAIYSSLDAPPAKTAKSIRYLLLRAGELPGARHLAGVPL